MPSPFKRSLLAQCEDNLADEALWMSLARVSVIKTLGIFKRKLHRWEENFIPKPALLFRPKRTCWWTNWWSARRTTSAALNRTRRRRRTTGRRSESSTRSSTLASRRTSASAGPASPTGGRLTSSSLGESAWLWPRSHLTITKQLGKSWLELAEVTKRG